MSGEVDGPAPGGLGPIDESGASLVLGLLLLASDEARAILGAARRELQPAAERQAATGASGDGGAPTGLRQSLIGAAFDLQRQMVVVGARLGRPWWRAAGRTIVWVWRAPPLGGVRTRIEADAARLARNGAEQEARARRLAAATVDAAVHRATRGLLDQEFEDVYQRAIARVLETPEIAELVREQSAGLAQEVATSVRDRAVTGDDLVERLVRRVLRRRGAGGAAPLPRGDGIEAEA